MKKEEFPVLIGLVLVGFFMLFILASSTSNLHLTGHAILGEYASEEDCVSAEYVWENLTEENCTTENVCVNETSDCEPCLEYEDINGTQGDCISFSSCVEEVCTEEETCEDVVVGGQCTGEVCNDTCESLEYECETQTICGEEILCGTCEEGYSCETNSCELIVETCTEEWNCGGWADCSGTSQTRTCTDTNECGTEEDKPLVSQSCEEEETTAEETTTEETTTTTTESTEKTVEQIIAEMESAQVTPNEEAENSEEQKNLESLGELTGGIVGGDFNESECSGCVFDEKCYKVDKRKNNSYCTEEGWTIQKEINVTCVEDFECLSNSCEEEQCGDYNWLRKFFDWIKGVFIKEIELNKTQIIVSDEVVE